MVAKLSNRCFDLVVKLGQEKKVTQSDFLALYKKTEAQQHQLLLDLLAGRKTFDELKKERRGAAKDQTARRPTEDNYKDMADQIARLEQRNEDLRLKLEQMKEDRDKERKRANELTEKLRKVEKEKQKEFNQYRIDVENLITEKNALSESFTSSEYNELDLDDLSPLKVIDDYQAVRKRRKNIRFVESTSKEGDVRDPGEDCASDVSESSDDITEIPTSPQISKVPVSAHGINKNDRNEPIITKKVLAHKRDESKNELSKKKKVITDNADSSDGEDQENGEASFVNMRGRDESKSPPKKKRKVNPDKRKTNTKKMATEPKKTTKTKQKPARPSKKQIASTRSQENQGKEPNVPETQEIFQDQWDYDMGKLSEGEWVAVAYDDGYYVGQVENVNRPDMVVGVNFLRKSSQNDYFYWPEVKDRANVSPTVIFFPKVKVSKESRKFKVLNLNAVVTAFAGFSQKYF